MHGRLPTTSCDVSALDDRPRDPRMARPRDHLQAPVSPDATTQRKYPLVLVIRLRIDGKPVVWIQLGCPRPFDACQYYHQVGEEVATSDTEALITDKSLNRGTEITQLFYLVILYKWNLAIPRHLINYNIVNKKITKMHMSPICCFQI